MNAERLDRKLAAILYADVAGYSRLTGEDEDATHRALSEYLDLISKTIEEHRGQVMHYAGDAVLAKFDAVVAALSAAVAIQKELKARNQPLPDQRKVQFRIGVNLGDVIEDRGDIYGDGVNVAARLESLAEPGGLCISEAVRTAIGKKLPFDYEFMGEQQVKNIEEPVRAYKVRLGGETAYSPTTPVGTPAKPSLAVLPFVNMSGDPDQEYFADGITEDITTALSNSGWFFVTARHSAFAYKGKAIDVRQVGKELGVQYVLEGSVRKGGDKIRVTAQLIETATGKHIWANRYDGKLEDIFDLQDQITETIVATLEPEFHRAEAERVAQKRPESMEAYDYLLRGVAYMNKLTPEDTRTALQYFRKAIEKDPNYGRAYAYACWCYRREVESRGMVLSKKEQAEVIRLMEAGLKADKNDPIVVWQAGSMKVYFQRDFEGALALIERSLSIDPNSTRALTASSMAHSFIGDTETAIKHAERAIRISPRSPAHWMGYTFLAQSHLQELRYEEAANAAKKAIQLNPHVVLAHLVLAASCAHRGQLDEAHAAIQEALKLNPKLTVARFPELFPISKLKNLDAYLTGLRKAGLPD
jgi:TolB-like protein/class 3 adenylate cyclase/Tfp pilus assembly protein PilF